MNTTVGQVLLDDALPEDMRGVPRVLDKKGLAALMEEIADKHPDDFRKINHALWKLGQEAAHTKGSSFSIKDLRAPPEVSGRIAELRQAVTNIVEDTAMAAPAKDRAIKELVTSATPDLEELLYTAALKAKNPFALQVLSGSRGNKSQLRSMIGGDFLVQDHRDRVIPMPILTSYAQGVDPAEYWAGSYGARKGTISTKFATQDAGFFGKQLMQAAHRMVVTEDDCGTDRGILVPGDDADNAGALLARNEGDHEAGDAVTPRMMKSFGSKPVMIRSPLTCQARFGLCKKCVGIRESGGLPEIGDNVGVVASTSLTERLSQSQLNVKHTGGLAKGGKKGIEGGDPDREDEEEEAKPEISGFKLINQLAQVPTAFRGGAAVAQMDGPVELVVEEPQGGHSIVIRGEKHYVPQEFKVLVKPGQMVEAGDVLSEGVPNPADLVRHKGVGAGRRMFVDIFRKAFKDSGMNVNRRNIEVVARGLVNHVRVTDLDGPDGALPDDVMEYDALERDYQPRHGFLDVPPRKAVGMFLERPALHYTVGTRVTKSVADALDTGGIKSVYAHHDDPSFEPEMVPVMRQLSKTPNWQVRLGGSFLQTGMEEAVHRSRKSQVNDISYIPGLARGADFGRQLTTKGVY